MNQFDEITQTLVQILEGNRRPLESNVLAAELNKKLGARSLTQAALKIILMRQNDYFIETKPNEWGLKSWSPATQGVTRISIDGSANPWQPISGTVQQNRLLNVSFEEIAQAALKHLVPISQDQPTLDQLTIFHLTKSSFKSDSLLRETADSNYLVPPGLYEQTKNFAWRFPPMMQASFFIRPLPGVKPVLNVRAIFGVGSLIEYQEMRTFGESQRFQRRYVSKPEINTPADFAKISLNDGNFLLREDSETPDFCRKSAKPIFYETLIRQPIESDSLANFELPEVVAGNAVVKAYDEVGNKNYVIQQMDLSNPQGVDGQFADDKAGRWALVVYKKGNVHIRMTIQVKWRTDWDVIEVTLRFSNIFQTKSSGQIGDDLILLHSIFFPHLYVSVENASYLIGAQQHEECLHETQGMHRLNEKDRFISDLATQTNCVVTHSTIDENTLVITTYGVYETVRVDPIPGPSFSEICQDVDALIRLSTLSKAAIDYVRDPYRAACLLSVMRALRRAFKGRSGEMKRLHAYQWKAIQNRIEMLATKSTKKASVIRAPTGTGKTLVFFANAALHYLFTGQRALLTFPTRILNEDMFKRLTRFIYALREEMQTVDARLVDRISGGILIGSSDPSYNAIVSPKVGQMMVQYDGCPKCQESGKTSKIICQEKDGRFVGVCERKDCQHEIRYMTGPKEVGDVLPALTIATPDKLFYEATVSAPQKALRFFGAPCIRCICGYHISLLNKAGQVGDKVECNQCKRIIDKEQAYKAGSMVLPKVVKSPPLYFVLDEIHSLYGITATLISYFFSLLREMAKDFDAEYEPTFESGTATIANERELIEAITHQEMMSFPADDEFFDFFEIKADRVRYRSVLMMPVGKATRSTITNSILNGYRSNQAGGLLRKSLPTAAREAYDFLLAYIPRKVNGYTIANELRRVLDGTRIEFLSGDAPSARLVTVLQEVLDRKNNLLLANMVVSLGIDIPRLNNMLMLGIPKSMTEMIQTVGRTGRGDYPGHVVIHLQPSIPRDEFVYRYFHRVMGDVTGYFDRKPIAPVNVYVADLILINVLHALLSTRLIDDYRTAFCDNAGAWLMSQSKVFTGRLIKEILGRGGTQDVQREVIKTIQPRLRDVVTELTNKRNLLLFQWVSGRPDVLYSLRARADRTPVVVSNSSLLNSMGKNDDREIDMDEDTAN